MIFLALAFACNESNLYELEDGYGGDGPQIKVEPDAIDFGQLGADAEAVSDLLIITSVGNEALTVSGVDFAGEGYNSFHLLEDFVPQELLPGESIEVPVVFEPWGNDEHAIAQVLSDDRETPAWPVDLYGGAIVPELDIDPDPMDHGDIGVGCDRENTATLSSVGEFPITISSISVDGDGFSLVSAPTLPLTLAPGESTTVDLRFVPSAAASYEGALVVVSDEAMGTREARQTGAGVVEGEVMKDVHQIPEGDPPSDIVFAIDSSCSMSGDAWSLVNNFETFINELEDYSSDWRVIVAAEDDGCNTSGILLPSTPNYQSTFQDAVFWAGIFADWTEALLTINRKSAEEMVGGCNAGFMRSGALLHIIDVTDEPEQSVEMGGLPWDDNVQAIIDAKGNAAMVRISAIAGPIDGSGSSCSAAPGTGYHEAVEMTGGVFLNICDNWASSANMALLAEASINQSTFELSGVPIPETIEVNVDGTVRSDWSYDAARNVVVFSGNYPSAGQQVVIVYEGAGECTD